MQTGLFGSAHMKILVALVMLMVIIALGSFASVNFERLEFLNPNPMMISVTGEGEVMAVPDIGEFSFSVNAEGESASEAQELSETSINDILVFLSEQGVAEKDIKTTNYNLYPRYRYEERVCVSIGYCPPGEQVEDGFEVTQTVTVKVRDTAVAGSLIAGVGERGATNISNLTFTIDDTNAIEAEAKAAAIVDAQEKANVLAQQLGVRIVRMAYYSEDTGMYYPEPYMLQERAMAFDTAEGGVAKDLSLPVGENTTKKQVTITYEVR